MKTTKISVLVLGIALLISPLNTYAQEAGNQETNIPNNAPQTLIDFTQFEEKIKASGLFPESDPLREKSISDLSSEEVTSDNLQPKYQLTANDMSYDKWYVYFNSSADTVITRKNSHVKKVNLREGKTYQGAAATDESDSITTGTGNSVLGVQIYFPTTPYSAYAEIKPPYEIPTYDKDGNFISRDESGRNLGVIDNVGKISKMSIEVSGRNQKNGIAIRLKDNLGKVKEYFMGYAYFTNWRRLSWSNPTYNPYNNHPRVFRIPLYPTELPFAKFHSIVVYRGANNPGGYVVNYFRKIDLWFDFAVSPDLIFDLDIDDEKNWGIIKKRAMAIQKKEQSITADRIESIRAEKIKKGKNAMSRKNLEDKDQSTTE